MWLSRIGFSLLLMLGAASAFAGQNGHDGREFARVFHLQDAALERNMPGAEQAGQRQGESSRRGRYLEMPDSSGYGTQGDSGPGAQENSRRQGKMSPEERRALRRQIDEAGHDLYLPKR